MSKKVKEIKRAITPIVDVITIFLVVLFLGASVFFIFLLQTEEKVEQQTGEQLIDSKVLMLMQSTDKLEILKDIYAVWDDASYLEMKNSELVGTNVKEMLFSGDSYKGNYSSKPTVTLSGSRFNPDASNLVSEYYTTVVVDYNGNVKSYNVVVDFIDNVLIEMRVIP